MAQKKVNYPLVGVIMGSTSDWETMREACKVLQRAYSLMERISFKGKHFRRDIASKALN